MATELTMPRMGFDMTEGKLAQWLKRVGDPVKRGEPVAEIETDKVNIEIEAPADGVLRGVFLEPGQTVPVGALIGVVGSADEALDLDAMRRKAAVETAPVAAPSAPATPQAAPPVPAGAVSPAVTPVAPAPPKANGRIKASPLARRRAKEAGLNLAELTGTGPGGRIVRRDVDAAIATGRIMPVAMPAAPRVPTPAILGPAVLKQEIVPLTKLRQTIARRMTASKQQAPHFYVTGEIDMAEAMALRARLNELTDEAGKISVNDMVVKAAALALTHFPNLNASFAENAIQRYGAVHVGIAVALPTDPFASRFTR